MTEKELCDLLIESGFDYGWAMTQGKLILWEHEQEPPAPLTRPETLEA